MTILVVFRGAARGEALRQLDEALAGSSAEVVHPAGWGDMRDLRRRAREGREVVLCYADALRRGGWGLDLALLGVRRRIWEPVSVVVSRRCSTWFRQDGLSSWEIIAPGANEYDRIQERARAACRGLSGDPLADSRRATWRDAQMPFLALQLRWPAVLLRGLLLVLYQIAFWPLVLYGLAWSCVRRGAARGSAGEIAPFVDACPGAPGLALYRALEGRSLSGTVLDAPCGEVAVGKGVVSRLYFGGRVDVAVEFLAEDAAEGARARAARLVAVGSVYHLPWRDGGLATVLCVQSVGSFRNLHGALREMSRVVRPGGHLHVTWMAESNARNTPKGLFLLLFSRARFPAFERRYRHRFETYHFLTRDEWNRALREAGLTMEAWRPFLSRRIGLAWGLMWGYVEFSVGDVFPFIPRAGALRRTLHALTVAALVPWFVGDEKGCARSGGVGVTIGALRPLRAGAFPC